MDSEHASAPRRYPMHTPEHARLSLGLAMRDLLWDRIDEATYRDVASRIRDRWPELSPLP
jgi:hypothetical protein